MNISLAVFNLLPFPPLDGSKILETFLPASMQPILMTMERYGFMILMVLMYLGFFSAIIRPVINLVDYLLLLGVSCRPALVTALIEHMPKRIFRGIQPTGN